MASRPGAFYVLAELTAAAPSITVNRANVSNVPQRFLIKPPQYAPKVEG